MMVGVQYMRKGFIKRIFKCLDRTRCLLDLGTNCNVQDMSRKFSTKVCKGSSK